jgi:hypothetical protein
MAGPTYYEATVNIAMNEDWVVPFVYGTFAPDGITVVPFDLTGSTLKMEIRVQEADNEAIVSVNSPDNGIEFYNNDPTTGEFFIAITRDKLWRLYPGNFFIDCVRLTPSGYQERLWEGTATVVQGTTR